MVLFAKNAKADQGMTMVELLVAVGLLVLVFTGIMMSYLNTMELQETAQSTSAAIRAAAGRLEQIRATTFSQITATYDNVPFAVTGLDGMGVTYINSSDPALLLVTVSVSWRSRNDRVHGGDKNLNGQIDDGDDSAGGMLTSPVQLVTKIFKK